MAKKKVIIEPWEDKQKWLCTFNDLMTLLLTFFVLILSMSSLDAKSVRELQQEMLDALGLMQAGKVSEETIIEKIFDLDEIGKRLKIFKNLFPSLKDEIDDEDMIEADDQQVKRIEDFVVIKEEGQKKSLEKEKEDVFNQFREIVADGFNTPGITVLKKNRGIVLRLQDSILFNPGKTELKDKQLLILKKVAMVLKKTKLKIYIEGHTDSQPVHTAKYPSNWELSVARAVSVAECLIGKYQVSPEKIRVGGYGDTVPVAPDNTPENRRKNRRIEIILSRS